VVNSKGDLCLNQDQNRNEPHSEKDTGEQAGELFHQEAEIPLFLRDTSEGKKGDAQDEKDKTGE
jgi:hypothetical protein